MNTHTDASIALLTSTPKRSSVARNDNVCVRVLTWTVTNAVMRPMNCSIQELGGNLGN